MATSIAGCRGRNWTDQLSVFASVYCVPLIVSLGLSMTEDAQPPTGHRKIKKRQKESIGRFPLPPANSIDVPHTRIWGLKKCDLKHQTTRRKFWIRKAYLWFLWPNNNGRECSLPRTPALPTRMEVPLTYYLAAKFTCTFFSDGAPMEEWRRN
jgi:hypothetical protein